MRKIYLVFSLLYTVLSISQSISVNTSTYTVPQLVTDVLVNSPCSQVRNITWKTGTNFGSSNGIGYFQNTNPAFPLTSGVILSTGNVANAPGPNNSDLSDGLASWSGDTDLEATLLSSGISLNTLNATVLEFDFTTFTTYFNFEFLFASEEYGTYQCKSNDAFAFLLTDSVTGSTTNLAVVPSTSTPISVQTIRNNLYESSCPSANTNFFGSFNGGSASGSSATNYNGQTVVMNASSTLIPNRSYHIKLVIADGKDTKFDSAIFLGGSSFKFNQDVLGADLTVANGTALCSNGGINQNYTITSGLDPSLFNFVWKDQSGTIVGSNSPNLTINQPGTYTLTYYIKTTNCEVATNDIVIEYNAGLTTPDPENLFKCNSGLSNYTFNLSFNTPIVNPSGQNTVSYHNLLIEAQNNSNPLPNSITVASSNLPKTIWVRIESPNGCYTTKSFILDLTTAPIANNPGDITECESTAGSGKAAFDLTTQTNAILGGQSPLMYSVSYHNTLNDANTNANPIDISNPLITASTTIYVRVETKTDPNCFNTVSFKLIVKAKPILDVVPDQYVCIEYVLPALLNPGEYWSGPNQSGINYPVGFHITTNQTVYIYHATGGNPNCYSENSFKVFVIGIQDITPSDISGCDKVAIPSYVYPGMRYFKFPGGPGNATNVEYFPGDLITTLGTTTVYVYFTYTDIGCPSIVSQFNIVITKTPTISTVFKDSFDCTQVNSLSSIVTDVGTANYYTLDTTTGIYTAISFPITVTTHVYAFAENGSCRSTIYDFMVYINSLGLPNIDTCSSPYTLTAPPLGEYRDAPNGGGNIIPAGNINVNTRVYAYIPGATCTNDDFFDITFYKPILTTPTLSPQCESYILPTNPEGGRYFTLQNGPNNSSNIEKFPGDLITTTTTLYIYKESSKALTPVCYTDIPWTITINPKPVIDSRGNQIVCYSYTLTPLINGNYFDDPNGQNPITNLLIDASTLNANDDIPNRIKKIYIYAANANDPTCFSEDSFTISFDGIEATELEDKTVCNTFTLPPLPANNFYYNASHLNGGGNLIAAGTTFNSSTIISPIYVYTESKDRFGGDCKDESSFIITIVDTPVANTVTTTAECDTYTGKDINGNNSTFYDGIFTFDLTQYESQVLGTQSPATNYSYSYFKTQTEALNPLSTAIANPSSYVNSTPFNETIWVRIYNSAHPEMCYGVTSISLKVNPLPDPHLATEYFLCQDYVAGTPPNNVIIDSGITGSNYSFIWTKDGNPYGGNTASISTNQSGNYSVTIKNTTTQCFITSSTKVTLYSPHIEIIYSDAFENPSFITINVLGAGSGNYDYQIDNQPFQQSNIFYNVTTGEHTITVRDRDGHCSPLPVKAVVINYPKFFTPNGDGYNETWNIKDLIPTNPNATIFIFDRYGKLIKQISPSTGGWNGTYNGEALPATDYWFTVQYDEKGTQKTFRSHFALKR